MGELIDTAPTSRGFDDCLATGNDGEVAVARSLARYGDVIRRITGAELRGVLVKVGLNEQRVRERVDGVRVLHLPTPLSEQRRGDIALFVGADRVIHVEIKTEDYALAARADHQRRETPNVAIETHDGIEPEAYARLWAKHRLDRYGRLMHPVNVAFNAPLMPEWYSRPGGHLKSEAEWLIHKFERSGDLVVMSMARLHRALYGGVYDNAPWFATCTLRRGYTGVCRDVSGRGIAYYATGKRVPVRDLERRGIAFSVGLDNR